MLYLKVENENSESYERNWSKIGKQITNSWNVSKLGSLREWMCGLRCLQQREQQGDIRHCWEAKLDIVSACSIGDVWKAPLLDLFIPGSITEELEPGVLWWAAALRSNESLGSAGSHPKMWKELGNEDREQGKKRQSLKSTLTWGQQRVAKGWADFERRKYLKLQSRGSGIKETHWTRTRKQSLRTLRVLRKWGKYLTICLHFVTANSTEVITRYR